MGQAGGKDGPLLKSIVFQPEFLINLKFWTRNIISTFIQNLSLFNTILRNWKRVFKLFEWKRYMKYLDFNCFNLFYLLNSILNNVRLNVFHLSAFIFLFQKNHMVYIVYSKKWGPIFPASTCPILPARYYITYFLITSLEIKIEQK